MVKSAWKAWTVALVIACTPNLPSVAPDSPNPWSRWIEIDGALVHYIDTAPGSDVEALVIIPGFLGCSETFLPLVERLRSEFRVLVLELPGFGLSERTGRKWEAEAYAEFLDSFRRRLGLDSFSLVGSSMGALVTARFASRHPDEIEHLVFLSPFGAKGQAGLAERIRRADLILPLVVRFISESRVRRELNKQVRDPAVLSPPIIEGLCRPFQDREGRRFVLQIARGMLAACSFDDCLPLLGMPVLVLAGGRDPLIDPAVLEIFERKVQDCRICLFPECCHMLYLDDPGPVSGLIIEFCSAPKGP